jgi:hypothetical protein
MIEKIKIRWNCFKKGVLNLVHYFYVIWNDRDWDWCFMMDLQKRKLDSMIKHYETNNCFIDQEIELRYMKIAKYCIENLGNVNATKNKYINDKNFERIRSANGHSPMENGFWKAFKDKNYEYFINDVYEEKLWYLYNKIIQTRARKWWD